MSAFLSIIDYNYVAQDSVNVTASSENPDFPATNIGSEFRSKVWRSSGNFTITTDNNNINFKETGGGLELTCSVPVGSYSGSTLALAIKTALDGATVNGRTYTVTQSQINGKWTIAGSTFLSLLFSTGTDAATSIRDAIGMGDNDFTGATTYTGPKASIHTEEFILIDLFTSEEIDTLALVFDPRLGIKFSESAVITLQANAADSWASPLFEQVLNIDNTWSIVTNFNVTSQSHRFWRIKIVDSENANLYVELGKIVLGLAFDIGRCPDNGFDIKYTDQSRKESNSYGNEYVDIYPIKRAINFNFNILDYDVKKNIESVFQRAGTRYPIFVMVDPTETLFDKDDFSIYGKFDKDIQFKHIVRNYFSSGIQIVEVF